jgi:BirA family biotin operon repressor/biotin-[acetyl-CoA-carboxylase] ligase
LYKYFSKTLFCGKQALYLPSCHSTNLVAAEQIRQKKLPEGLLVYTGYQSKGRGQMGNTWESSPDQNILMSLVLHPNFLQVSEQFYLSQICALAITDALAMVHPHPWQIKWPNDILTGNQKVAGILIENLLAGNYISHAILGVGMNVNQQHFTEPRATSLALKASRVFDTDEVLETVLLQIEKWYIRLKNHQYKRIEESYFDRLKGFETWENYTSGGKTFEGKITGIEAGGKLVLQLRDGTVQNFDFKEIRWTES